MPERNRLCTHKGLQERRRKPASIPPGGNGMPAGRDLRLINADYQRKRKRVNLMKNLLELTPAEFAGLEFDCPCGRLSLIHI